MQNRHGRESDRDDSALIHGQAVAFKELDAIGYYHRNIELACGLIGILRIAEQGRAGVVNQPDELREARNL